jgi:hypothetical protein
MYLTWLSMINVPPLKVLSSLQPSMMMLKVSMQRAFSLT